jgi:hypothetical protein
MAFGAQPRDLRAQPDHLAFVLRRVVRLGVVVEAVPGRGQVQQIAGGDLPPLSDLPSVYRPLLRRSTQHAICAIAAVAPPSDTRGR